MSDEFELTSDERSALAELPRDAVPPAEIEERTVRALRARGLLRGSRGRTMRWIAMAVAAVLLFVAGFAVGKRAAMSARDEGSSVRVVAWF